MGIQYFKDQNQKAKVIPKKVVSEAYSDISWGGRS